MYHEEIGQFNATSRSSLYSGSGQSQENWWLEGRGMCYPVCGMMHIKKTLLLIGKGSLCGVSGFPLSLSERSFIICLTPYKRE